MDQPTNQPSVIQPSTIQPLADPTINEHVIFENTKYPIERTICAKKYFLTKFTRFIRCYTPVFTFFTHIGSLAPAGHAPI